MPFKILLLENIQRRVFVEICDDETKAKEKCSELNDVDQGVYIYEEYNDWSVEDILRREG